MLENKPANYGVYMDLDHSIGSRELFSECTQVSSFFFGSATQVSQSSNLLSRHACASVFSTVPQKQHSYTSEVRVDQSPKIRIKVA